MSAPFKDYVKIILTLSSQYTKYCKLDNQEVSYV